MTIQTLPPDLLTIPVSHDARAHHTRAYLSVREALARYGCLSVWQHPMTGRVARVCWVAPRLYGVQIVEQVEGEWVEITSFVKSKMVRIEQVERYLRNAGYEPMEDHEKPTV